MIANPVGLGKGLRFKRAIDFDGNNLIALIEMITCWMMELKFKTVFPE